MAELGLVVGVLDFLVVLVSVVCRVGSQWEDSNDRAKDFEQCLPQPNILKVFIEKRCWKLSIIRYVSGGLIVEERKKCGVSESRSYIFHS